MKVRICIALAFSLLAIGVVQAQEASPSDASIRELLDVTHAAKLIDSMQGQMHGMFEQMVDGALGHAPDAQERQILQRQEAKMENLMKRQFTWSKFEPMVADIYRKSFSQKEINDLLAFYKSPSGQAVIAKMPVVMQQSMVSMQTVMKQILPQVQQIGRETGEELEHYEASKAKAKPATSTVNAPAKS
jgi:hypothetical protein